MHPTVARVVDVLSSAGWRGEVASALGCDVGAIARSLVFRADSAALLVLSGGAPAQVAP